MGKLVTFWSPYAGKSKTTSSMCAVAAACGMNNPDLSIAISHTGSGDFTLEANFDERTGTPEEKEELYGKTGITALKVNYRQAALTSEKIRRSAVSLRMQSLFFYPNAERGEDTLSFLLLTDVLKKEFNLTFLEMESGWQENTEKYFSVSDWIVVVLPQDPKIWDMFFRKEMVHLEETKCCIIIGGYMKNTKYEKRFFVRKAQMRSKAEVCGVIPLNAGFSDAMTEGKTLDYFYRNQKAKSKEENYEFIVQTKKTAENIRKKVFSS